MIRQIVFVMAFLLITPTGVAQSDTTKKVEINKMTFELPGRHIIKLPPNVTDQFQKGIVVLNIVVDSSGTVLKASPDSERSTTKSVALFARARQAAFRTKFDKTNSPYDQTGTLTIAVDLEK